MNVDAGLKHVRMIDLPGRIGHLMKYIALGGFRRGARDGVLRRISTKGDGS